MTTNLRAAIYVRLSEETETSTSPARQREIGAQYAEARGWTVVGTYEDLDVSATRSRLDRPGLGALQAAIDAGEVDVVVVWRLDRLARKLLDLLTLLDRWTASSVSAVSASEGVDMTTAAGRAMASLIGIFAEMEAEAIRARVTSSVDALRRGGRFSGGVVPYGYLPTPAPDGPGRVLTVDPEEAEVVSEILRRVTAGESLTSLCLDLTARGIPAPKSPARKASREGAPAADADPGRWLTTTLSRMILRDTLLGRQTHRGEVLRDASGLPAEVWPPVVSRGALEAARAALRPSSVPEGARRRTKRARLLSGLLSCSGCGRPLYVGSGSHPAYRCSARAAAVDCPAPVTINAEGLDAYVSAEAVARLGARPVTETVRDEAGPSPETVAALDDVEAGLREASEALTADGADVPDLVSRIARLKALRADLRASVDEAAPLYVVRDTGRTWAEDYAAADLVGRQGMLRDAISSVRVRPSTGGRDRFDAARAEILWIDPNAEGAEVA